MPVLCEFHPNSFKTFLEGPTLPTLGQTKITNEVQSCESNLTSLKFLEPVSLCFLNMVVFPFDTRAAEQVSCLRHPLASAILVRCPGIGFALVSEVKRRSSSACEDQTSWTIRKKAWSFGIKHLPFGTWSWLLLKDQKEMKRELLQISNH